MRNLLLPFFILTGWASFAVAQQSPDYFKVHAGELPVKAFYGLKAQPMSLQAVDPKKGIIYCKQGGGNIQLELRSLDRQNIKGFVFDWRGMSDKQ